jgi:hypothetical protein
MKEYKKPSIKMSDIEIENILAGSLNNDGTSGDTNNPGAGDAGGAAGNQNNSFWDDED